VRDRAVIPTFLFAGLRRNGLLDLGVRDGLIVVRWGKGNRTRVVPVGVPLRIALGEWLAARPHCGMTTSSATGYDC
jgi:site-specific recombinase XerC